jgi:hypothetical protein
LALAISQGRDPEGGDQWHHGRSRLQMCGDPGFDRHVRSPAAIEPTKDGPPSHGTNNGEAFRALRDASSWTDNRPSGVKRSTKAGKCCLSLEAPGDLLLCSGTSPADRPDARKKAPAGVRRQGLRGDNLS